MGPLCTGWAARWFWWSSVVLNHSWLSMGSTGTSWTTHSPLEEERKGEEYKSTLSGQRYFYFHMPGAVKQHIHREICHPSSTVHLPSEHKITITQCPLHTSFYIKAICLERPTGNDQSKPLKSKDTTENTVVRSYEIYFRGHSDQTQQ